MCEGLKTALNLYIPFFCLLKIDKRKNVFLPHTWYYTIKSKKKKKKKKHVGLLLKFLDLIRTDFSLWSVHVLPVQRWWIGNSSQCTSKRTTDSLQSLVCSYDFDKSIKILTQNVDLLQHYFARHMVLRACFSSSLWHCRLVCFIINALSNNYLCAGARCLFLFLLLLIYVITLPTSDLACITPVLFVVAKERPFRYYLPSSKCGPCQPCDVIIIKVEFY